MPAKKAAPKKTTPAKKTTPEPPEPTQLKASAPVETPGTPTHRSPRSASVGMHTMYRRGRKG